MALEFKTAKKTRKPIPFTLDGRDFTFTPPKQSALTMPLIDVQRGVSEDNNIKILLDWLGQGLSEEDEKFLEDRVRDPKDDLDIDDLDDICAKLMEEIAGRPTG